MKDTRDIRCRSGIAALWGLLFSCFALNVPWVLAADHLGKDFWVCFPSGMQEPYLFITAQSDASVTVQVPGLAWSDSFSVPAGQGVKRAVPWEAHFDYETDDGIENKGVHVRATADIAVYGYSGWSNAEASFLALPVDGLGFEYLAASYSDAGADAPSAHFLVLAPENNTKVTVIPSDDYGARTAENAYTISLDQGQVYRLGGMQSGTTYDLTGSRICADKPVAVYIGAAPGYIPGSFCCADAIVDQAPPVSDLGIDYLVVPYTDRDCGDFVRVVAAYDGTEVKINGAAAAIVNRGEFHQENVFAPLHITSNLPVLVVQFMKAELLDWMFGDPELMVVTPTSSFLSGYLAMTDDSSTWYNYSNIVVPTQAAGSLLVDGVAPAPGGFFPIGTSGYSYISLAIAAGVHTFSCSSPFGTYLYGKRWCSSYAYSAGMALDFKEGCPDLRIDISPAEARTIVGQEACFALKVTDNAGVPVPGEEIEIHCSGANSWRHILFSDADGVARHCYAGRQSGQDEVIAALTCGCGTGAYDRASVIWTDLGTLRIFPNPFDRKTAVRGTVKFEGLQIGSQVRVYTTRGLKVWEGTVDRPYILEWDGRNEIGDPVAPGTYLWVAEFKGSKWDGILVVK